MLVDLVEDDPETEEEELRVEDEVELAEDEEEEELRVELELLEATEDEDELLEATAVWLGRKRSAETGRSKVRQAPRLVKKGAAAVATAVTL